MDDRVSVELVHCGDDALLDEGEFEAASGLLGEPSFGFLRNVRGMIVEDQLDCRVGWIGGVEKLEEFDEFAAAVAILDQSVNRAGEQVDAGQQPNEYYVAQTRRNMLQVQRKELEAERGVLHQTLRNMQQLVSDVASLSILPIFKRRAIKREAKTPIEIGRLLIEAKEQLNEHGEWLDWLGVKFPHTARTAQRYMSTARLAAKYDTVSHLKLSASGLYPLASDGYCDYPELIERVLQEAETKWIDADRVEEIAAELADEAMGGDDTNDDEAPLPPDAGEAPPPPDAAPAPFDDDDDREPDDDRPPPAPPPGLTPRQAALLRRFDEAASALVLLAAKSSREFVATSIPASDLKNIAAFLEDIAKQLELASVPAE